MTSIIIDRTDGLSSAVAIKGPCFVATTGDIVLSGHQTIDGALVVSEKRVLVWKQSIPSENGIWISDTGPWRRASDFSRTADVVKGTCVIVTDGATYAGWEFYVDTDGPINVGETGIAFTLGGLGGTSPAIAQKHLGFQVDLSHFGPVVYGGYIDTVYQAALDFITARGYGEIVIPAGEYKFQQGHVYSFSNLSPNPLRNQYGIRGAGQGLTRLIFEAASSPTSGLGFEQTTLGANMRVNFADFTILSDGVCNIYALTASRPAGGISPDATLIMQNVSVQGLDNVDDRFALGAVNATGALYAKFLNLDLSGARGGGTDYTDTSVTYGSAVGIMHDSSYGGFFINCFVKYFAIGLSNVWASSPAGEGINLIHSNFVLNKIGLKYVRTTAEPSLKIGQCHFNNRDVNIWLDGVFGYEIAESSLYNQTTGYTAHSASPVVGTAFDVYARNTYDGLITACKHRGTGGANKALYKFVSGANNPINTRIVDTSLEGCTFTHLVDGPATMTGFVRDPLISSNSVNTGGLLLSAPTPIGIRKTTPEICELGLSAAQPVPNNVTTDISWTEGSDPAGLHDNVTNPDRITIPAGKGYKWIRFNGNGGFANNNLGTRQFQLFKNGGGSVVNYGFSVTQDGTAAGVERINFSTGWLAVSDGDYFTVGAYQNSGGALDLETVHTTMLVEVRG